jgi:hypothetical protein
MATTYNVRIWKTKVYNGQRGTTYYVRWTVDGREWKEPYKTVALAESFRSDLVSAARRGEAFDVDTGRPVSMRRAGREMSWYDRGAGDPYQVSPALVEASPPLVIAAIRERIRADLRAAPLGCWRPGLVRSRRDRHAAKSPGSRALRADPGRCSLAQSA